MKQHLLASTLFFSLGASSIFAQCTLTDLANNSNYVQVWGDEFNYTSQTETAFMTKWTAVNQSSGWNPIYNPQINIVSFNSSQVTFQNGVVRLTAEKFPSSAIYKSGALKSKQNIDTYMAPDAGFHYGILEFRAKLPAGAVGVHDVFPVLGSFSSSATELRVVDGMHDGREIASRVTNWQYTPGLSSHWIPWTTDPNALIYIPGSAYSVGDIVINYTINSGSSVGYYKCVTAVPVSEHRIVYQQREGWTAGIDFSADFHVYSIAWTPNKVTFFIDGRETFSVDATMVPTVQKTASIIMALDADYATNNTNATNLAYMDIDYVRLYRPKNLATGLVDNTQAGYNNAPYKTNQEYMFRKIGILPYVHTAPNSIVTNPNNPNEVFYRGNNNRLYRAVKSGGNWTSAEIIFNYAYGNGVDETIKGDLVYSQEKIFYKGQDNRIQCFGTWNGPGIWSHGYVDSDWASTANLVSAAPGSLAANAQGEIFFRSYNDNKLRKFSWNSTNGWVGSLVGSHTYSSDHYISSDLIVNPVDGNVFYKGMDNKIQLFYKSGSTYIHGHVDWNITTVPKAGTMVTSNSQICYIGYPDNKLYQFYWNGTSWSHNTITGTNWIYETVSPNIATFNYLKSTYGHSALAIDPTDNTGNTLVYVGLDGRIQQVKRANNTSPWQHTWIDNYWTTDYHSSYNYLNTSATPSLATAGGAIFYSQYKGYFSSLAYETCENLNPTPQYNTMNFRVANHITPSTIEDTETKLTLFPNPARDIINIQLEEGTIENIRLIDMSGRTIQTHFAVEQSIKQLDINGLTAGLYNVVVNATNGKVFTQKLVIE